MLNQKIIKICEQKLIYLNYSPRTKQIYLHYIEEFLKIIGNKQVIHLNSNDFQSYLDNYNFTSVSQQKFIHMFPKNFYQKLRYQYKNCIFVV